ncbi:MAG TPA: hypothetical protein VMS95_06470 [Candidatus Krumholzibacteriaceae bacterium]|jgi:hypothetical protein|nr:hypothetical protein [Candidatus Krumholzibacteriaceae bacterium]
MNVLKTPLALIVVLLVAAGLIITFAWMNLSMSNSYADLRTVLTTTTAVFGTMLGIITAGLMFTQGKFSELSSELTAKAPDYLSKVLVMEKMQPIETYLLALRKTFTKLAASTTVVEERNLYERIVTKASSIFVDFAVLLNLKLKQQGLPISQLLVSEMDSKLYGVYEKGLKDVKREWQIFTLIKQITDTCEAHTASFIEKSSITSPLEADLKSSIAILKLKEKGNKSLIDVRNEVAKALSGLNSEVGEISKRLHDDRIPQLLSQMKQASIIRGKYFYLALVFIVTPLLSNLLMLPQLSEGTVAFYQPIIAVTSVLSVMGVIFLLLYIHKILNV